MAFAEDPWLCVSVFRADLPLHGTMPNVDSPVKERHQVSARGDTPGGWHQFCLSPRIWEATIGPAGGSNRRCSKNWDQLAVYST
jgi:hypothetical protein